MPELQTGATIAVRVGRSVIEVTFRNRDRCGGPGKWVGCRQEILWAHYPKTGKMLPLDPIPDEGGCYTNHFATCPDAKHFKR